MSEDEGEEIGRFEIEFSHLEEMAPDAVDQIPEQSILARGKTVRGYELVMFSRQGELCLLLDGDNYVVNLIEMVRSMVDAIGYNPDGITFED